MMTRRSAPREDPQEPPPTNDAQRWKSPRRPPLAEATPRGARRRFASSAFSSGPMIPSQAAISAPGDSPTRGARAFGGRGAQHLATVDPPPPVSGDGPSVDFLGSRRAASDPIAVADHRDHGPSRDRRALSTGHR